METRQGETLHLFLDLGKHGLWDNGSHKRGARENGMATKKKAAEYTISDTEFVERYAEVIAELDARGGELVITRNGVLIARIAATDPETRAAREGAWADFERARGEANLSRPTPEEWVALIREGRDG